MLSQDKLLECPRCHVDLQTERSQELTPAFCLNCRFPLMLVAGKYRFVRVVKEGGFGVVYEARHTQLTRDPKRAIKVLKPELFAIPGMKERFIQEVQLTSALSQMNPHIIRIYDDFGQIPNLGTFYVMEHLEGDTLKQRLESHNGLLPLQLCYHLFLQLCDAMRVAHLENIIHRDLKPDNLFIIQQPGDPYFLKVLDFGIAKPLDAEVNDISLTQGLLGTPAYMPPEQCLKQPISRQSDIYAMGIILYELLAGRTPFLPRNPEQRGQVSFLDLIQAQIYNKPPPLRLVLPKDRVEANLFQNIIDKALAKQPGERYPTVEALRNDIVRILNPSQSGTTFNIISSLHPPQFSPNMGRSQQVTPAPFEPASLAQTEHPHPGWEEVPATREALNAIPSTPRQSPFHREDLAATPAARESFEEGLTDFAAPPDAFDEETGEYPGPRDSFDEGLTDFANPPNAPASTPPQDFFDEGLTDFAAPSNAAIAAAQDSFDEGLTDFANPEDLPSDPHPPALSIEDLPTVIQDQEDVEEKPQVALFSSNQDNPSEDFPDESALFADAFSSPSSNDLPSSPETANPPNVDSPFPTGVFVSQDVPQERNQLPTGSFAGQQLSDKHSLEEVERIPGPLSAEFRRTQKSKKPEYLQDLSLPSSDKDDKHTLDGSEIIHASQSPEQALRKSSTRTPFPSSTQSKPPSHRRHHKSSPPHPSRAGKASLWNPSIGCMVAAILGNLLMLLAFFYLFSN